MQLVRIGAAGLPPSHSGVHRKVSARGLPTRLARRPDVRVAIVAFIAVLLVVTSIAGYSAVQDGMFEIQSHDATATGQHPELIPGHVPALRHLARAVEVHPGR